MAVTGIFAADFGSFFDAVDKSEIKLKAFEVGANKVESGLTRMASSFSGQKIIQDATLMAKVFEDAGGASAFTEKELARMGATANEAVAKLKALGKDVPEGIQKIATTTTEADKSTQGFTTSVAGLAKGFLALSAVRATFDFVKDITATAGALSDLSAQTRINVEDLQIMAQAMDQFGVTTDELGRALFKLSKNITNGDDGVADALLQMGISLDEVRNMQGEELFLTIQRGLATLDGSLRDTTAVALYGEKLGMAMAGAAEGTDEAVDAARRLNNVMSKETVDALDAADEAIGRMTTNLKNMVANMIGPIAQGFNKVHDAIRGGAGLWETFVATLKDVGNSWDTGKDSATNLNAILGQLDQTTKATTESTKGATTAHRDHVPALESTAGATKKAREESEKLAAALAKEQDATKKRAEENEKQLALMERDARLNADRAAFDAEQKVKLDAKMAAGAGYMKQLEAHAKQSAENAAAEKALNAEFEKGTEVLKQQAAAHQTAGAAAEQGTTIATVGYQQMGAQLEITAEGIRAFIALQQYSASVNAILSRNSLFTSGSQYERIAMIPAPSFAGGIENFAGGVAKVHGGETLVNLPSGTSVVPAGGGGGVNVSNTFHLVDTESNLARRVSETIMRSVRAGTQMGMA